MRILITGENSFVGLNFVKYSQFRDIDQISLINNKPEDIDFSKYEVVLHLAGIVHQSKKISEELYYKINRDLAVQTAQNAKERGIKQFIFLSTVKVYGDSHNDPVRNEHSICLPTDHYGKSKLEAEKELLGLNDDKFKVSVIRSSVVYGEGVKANIRSLIKLVSRMPVLPLGGIKNRRSFVYVENLVSYIERVIIKRIPGIFIAADPEPVSTTALIQLISNSLGKKAYLFSLPGWVVVAGHKLLPGTFSRLFDSLEFDNSDTLKKLDFEIPYKTEEGISRTVKALS